LVPLTENWCCPECGSYDWQKQPFGHFLLQKCNKCNCIVNWKDLLSEEKYINKTRFEKLEKILNEEKINF
jgi:hypothetical protein